MSKPSKSSIESLRFSVCIPNFNYARYVGVTIESVRAQTCPAHEIVVSDNASTDDSVAVIRGIDDPRIRLRVNRCNIGFAGNLVKASEMAVGDWMTMLSSDDLMAPTAIKTYASVLDALGASGARCILSSASTVIDGEGKATGMIGIDWKQWQGAVRDDKASDAAGSDVWRIPARKLLAQALRVLRNPFIFATATYPKVLFDAVEGYSQGGLMNPDKRFSWALLGVADEAVFVDAPLFAYRVHASNQNAQQAAAGALKHLTDEYVATFMTPDALLKQAGVNRGEMVKAFVEHDIALRGLKTLGEGKVELARRMLAYGDACYPKEMRTDRKVSALRLALGTGPLGAYAAQKALKPALARWQKRQSGSGKAGEA